MPKPAFFPSLLVVVGAAVLLLLSWQVPSAPVITFSAPAFPQLPKAATAGQLRSASLNDLPSPKVHAFHAIDVGDELIAAWYGGSKEAAHDVALYTARYSKGRWSPATRILDSKAVARQQGSYNHTLGNPVLWLGPARTLWLFATQVPAGGWSSSQILVMQSNDLGATWNPSSFFVSSPLLNISTLTKSHPVQLEGGYTGLPVYHELARQRSELLVLDSSMRVVDKKRIAPHASAELIQPVVLAYSAKEATAVHRSMNASLPFIYRSSSQDGGNSWSSAEPLSLPNPDAAVHMLALDAQLWLLVYNHSRNDRHSIDVALSTNNGHSWQRVATLEHNTQARLGYPWLVQTQDGIIHAFYTYNRKAFRHHQFDRQWLAGQAQAKGLDVAW